MRPFKTTDKRATYVLEGTITADEIVRVAKNLVARKLRKGTCISSPGALRSSLELILGDLEHEVFGVLFLDTRHRVIAWEEMFRGTIDGASVYPREVVKAALFYNAAAVIMVHNHPSGNAEPSRDDVRITERLKSALTLVDVRVLDHMVVSGVESVSMAERGLI